MEANEWVMIPFNDWSKDRLERGMKSATSRNKKYGLPGHRFRVRLKGTLHTYELIDVVFMSLKDVAQKHWREEGAESPGEFIKVWNEIHPRKRFDPDHYVYFHKFKEVEKDEVEN
jgi:hypothetical protein